MLQHLYLTQSTCINNDFRKLVDNIFGPYGKQTRQLLLYHTLLYHVYHISYIIPYTISLYNAFMHREIIIGIKFDYHASFIVII